MGGAVGAAGYHHADDRWYLCYVLGQDRNKVLSITKVNKQSLAPRAFDFPVARGVTAKPEWFPCSTSQKIRGSSKRVGS